MLFVHTPRELPFGDMRVRFDTGTKDGVSENRQATQCGAGATGEDAHATL